MSIKSPCVLMCSIEEATGYCHGCGRTIDEISNWLTMSDENRETLMTVELPKRMEGRERPPRRETRRQRMARARQGE